MKSRFFCKIFFRYRFLLLPHPSALPIYLLSEWHVYTPKISLSALVYRNSLFAAHQDVSVHQQAVSTSHQAVSVLKSEILLFS